MQRTLLLTLILGLAVATTVTMAADAVEGIDDEPENPGDEGKAELEKMDKNKDGKADLEELKGYMKAEFYSPEDVKEEGLSDADVETKSTADAKEYLTELDKNKDGALDLEEFTAHYKEDMDDMDEEMDEAEEEEGEEEEGEEEEEEEMEEEEEE